MSRAAHRFTGDLQPSLLLSAPPLSLCNRLFLGLRPPDLQLLEGGPTEAAVEAAVQCASARTAGPWWAAGASR